MTIAGDLIYKFQDFLGAEEIAERIERTMPPALVPPKEGESPKPKMPPPPQMQIQMMKQQNEMAKLEVNKKKLDIEQAKLQVQKLKALKEAQAEHGEVKTMLLDLLSQIFGGSPASGPGIVE
jgi:hypothetical protein